MLKAKTEKIRPKRLMGGKPKGKRDSEGMYGFSTGGRVEKVDGIMDGNKAARRENMYGGGRMKYNAGKLVKKAMKKAMPC
jgi:hypothetical protein